MSAPAPTTSTWSDLSTALTPSDGWAHPGLEQIDGTFLTTDAHTPRVVSFDAAGQPGPAFEVPAREIHAIAADGDTLWLADPGNKECPVVPGHYETHLGEAGGQVLRTDREGTVLLRIGTPPLAVYTSTPFRPTSIALHEDDLWIADGYGADRVLHYRRDGQLLGEVGGPDADLDNPHSILWDPRGSQRLLIADRGHHRILAHDPATDELRTVITSEHVRRPSGMATWGPYLVVADLDGRVAVFDEYDRPVTVIGAAPIDELDRPGWPNRVVDGLVLAPEAPPGTFNSPHDVAITTEGTLVVCEWLVGGRLTAIDLPAHLPQAESR